MLIKYGFPLDFDGQTVIMADKINHKIATEYPSHVDAYLTEEAEHGAMGAPPNKRWVIIDLRWPKGQSVNSGANLDKYLDREFVLTYLSIDTDSTDADNQVAQMFIEKLFCSLVLPYYWGLAGLLLSVICKKIPGHQML